MTAKTYWEERLSGDFSLGGAGDRRLGAAYNQWLYRARRRALDRTVHALGLEVRGRRVLDLGSGTGFYVDYWLQRGAGHLTGVDITEVSVRNLQQRHPDMRFVCSDITAATVGDLGQFDIISAFDVLFHMADEEVFKGAWDNMKRCAADGAFVLVSDSMTATDVPMTALECHRSYEHYRTVAEGAGFQVVYLAPVFCTMLNPVDPREANFAVRGLWWFAVRALKASKRLRLNSVVGHALGATLYSLDALLLRFVRRGPGMKLMVLQKRAS